MSVKSSRLKQVAGYGLVNSQLERLNQVRLLGKQINTETFPVAAKRQKVAKKNCSKNSPVACPAAEGLQQSNLVHLFTCRQKKTRKKQSNQGLKEVSYPQEQLTEMTGLNSRVIRVWFQNRRCKEHKRVKAEVLITRKVWPQFLVRLFACLHLNKQTNNKQ